MKFNIGDKLKLKCSICEPYSAVFSEPGDIAEIILLEYGKDVFYPLLYGLKIPNNDHIFYADENYLDNDADIVGNVQYENNCYIVYADHICTVQMKRSIEEAMNTFGMYVHKYPNKSITIRVVKS